MKNLESLTEKGSNKIFTVPNVITFSRILMIFPILILFHLNTPGGYTVAFFLILFSYFTDCLDGFIARKTHSVSKIGMILDPISDKLISITIALALCFQYKLPLYYFLAITVRDILIASGGGYILAKEHKITLPLIWGKLNTLILGLMLGLYPLKYSSLTASNVRLQQWSDYAVEYGTYVSIGMIILSFIVYSVVFIKTVTEKSTSET